jgi:hypothetical protein
MLPMSINALGMIGEDYSNLSNSSKEDKSIRKRDLKRKRKEES